MKSDRYFHVHLLLMLRKIFGIVCVPGTRAIFVYKPHFLYYSDSKKRHKNFEMFYAPASPEAIPENIKPYCRVCRNFLLEVLDVDKSQFIQTSSFAVVFLDWLFCIAINRKGEIHNGFFIHRRTRYAAQHDTKFC